MRILTIGSGGREHALVWALAREREHELWAAPGNPGMARDARIVDANVGDIEALADLAADIDADLVVVGPEAPLVSGIADVLTARGISCFGPSRKAAMLEGSKWFAKEIMLEAGVPTAEGRQFEDMDEALSYMGSDPQRFVIKADGLAAGKGVFLPDSRPEAEQILQDLAGGRLGEAGARIVIEERLVGNEVSVLAVCSGSQALVLPASRDHKRIGEGDTGPNTGGMGAVCPPPELAAGFEEDVRQRIILPVLNTMADRGIEYRGVLYAGLIVTESGPRVLEFNVRFGDPEAQVVLPLVEFPLAEAFAAAAEGGSMPGSLSSADGAAACVIMASGGYPVSYEKGFAISGADNAGDVIVFHAGTALKDGELVTAGGRVLGVTGIGDDLDEALEKAYEGVSRIGFENSYFRRDIGRT